MNLERTLVRLVLADVTLSVAAVASGYTLEGMPPAPLQAYLAAERGAAGGPGTHALTALWWVMVAVSVVAWVALVQFWRRARETYLAASILWVTYLVLAGPRVIAAPELALLVLEAMAAGAILAVTCISDLRTEYRKTPQST